MSPRSLHHAVHAVTTLPDLTLSALELAPRLLGCRLVREDRAGRRVGVIVETEAYPGGADLASHTRLGRRTARNESMWLRGGHAYVYFTYGMHWMMNIVSGAVESGEAVLIRALRPTQGLDAMRSARSRSDGGYSGSDRDLCRGPARLCRALGIDRGDDGTWLMGEGVEWDAPFEAATLRSGGDGREPEPDGVPCDRAKRLLLEPAEESPAGDFRRIHCGPRIGIGFAGPWARRRWRFWLAGSPWVSDPVPERPSLWRNGRIGR